MQYSVSILKYTHNPLHIERETVGTQKKNYIHLNETYLFFNNVGTSRQLFIRIAKKFIQLQSQFQYEVCVLFFKAGEQLKNTFVRVSQVYCLFI